MYQYLGNLRLQLWFESPNICAAFLVMTVMLTLALLLFLLTRKGSAFRALSAVAAAAGVVQLLMLALTYSRGGYVAISAALLVAFLLCRKRILIGAFLFFCLSLLLIGSGVQRVGSIADIGEGSIRNRLLLWRGGLGLIAEHPIAGVDQVGKVYAKWHMPLWLNESYGTLISDFLTTAAYYGLPVLLAGLFAVFLAIWLSLRTLPPPEKNGCRSCLLGAVAGYLVAALFSTILFFWQVSGLFAAILVGLLAVAIHSTVRRRFRLGVSDFLIPAGAAAAVCLGIFLAGATVNAGLPYRYQEFATGGNGIVVSARPKQKANAEVFLFFTEETPPVRSMIRPLLERNFAVTAVRIDSGLQGLKEIPPVFDRILGKGASGTPVYLLAQTDAARIVTVTAAARPELPVRGIIAIDMPADWPWDELAPARHVSRLNIPLRLLYTSRADALLRKDGERLQALAGKHQVPCSLSMVEAGEKTENTLIDAIGKIIEQDRRQSEAAAMPEKPVVELFYREGCRECARVKADVLPRLGKELSGRYKLIYRNREQADEYLKLAAYQEYFKELDNAPVCMVINSEVMLNGYDEIAARAIPEIRRAIDNPRKAMEIPPELRDRLLTGRVERFNLFVVAIAGLIDGINPCVFAALIFFLSLLSVSKVKGRKLLVVGWIYCLACFLTYFALGFGIFNFLRMTNRFELLRSLIEFGTIFVLALLAMFSFIDAFRFRHTGEARNIQLQLPDSLKTKMHRIMRRGLQYRYLLPGIFMVGVVVTLIESVCTGQVYIPTLVLVTKANGFGISLFYLLIYNLAFLVPLLVVFWMAWRGMTSLALINWSKRQVFWSKLAMGVFFILLGLVMIGIRILL